MVLRISERCSNLAVVVSVGYARFQMVEQVPFKLDANELVQELKSPWQGQWRCTLTSQRNVFEQILFCPPALHGTAVFYF